MIMCDSGHDPIVFEGSGYRPQCPVCELQEDTEKLQGLIEELKTKIDSLEDEIATLAQELKESERD